MGQEPVEPVVKAMMRILAERHVSREVLRTQQDIMTAALRESQNRSAKGKGSKR